MQELKDKVVIITGASTPLGIGSAIARRFAQRGGSLFLVAEATEEQLSAVAKECRAQTGSGHIEQALIDLSVKGAAEEMVAQAYRLFGRVDVLINNAAVRSPFNFGDYTHAHFDQSIAVNIGAAFFASQAVIPIMRAQGGGRIIHMASQLGHVTYAQRALYGLTKAALIHLTKSMAYELGPENIIVNAISPGPVETQVTLDRGQETTKKRIEQYLRIGRVGAPTEIADLALFLATDSPAFLQGQDIVIDGGYIIH